MPDKLEAKRFFLATWHQLTDIECREINIPREAQKEIIKRVEEKLADLRSELAQELLDMEVRK